MDNREIINETLVHLFHEIQKLEEEAIITEDFKDLTNNDMHIIEAVGLEGGNMSSIAAKLDITVGSLTTSMNSLVKKGYTERERSEKDRRIVYIHLTGKGLIDRKIKNPCIRSNTLWMNGFGNDRDSLLYSPAKTYLCWRVCIFGTKYT